MAQKKHKPEEIVAKLRQVTFWCRRGVRLRRRSGPSGDSVHLLSLAQGVRGLKSDQVKRLKDLEKENERLRKAVSDRRWRS